MKFQLSHSGMSLRERLEARTEPEPNTGCWLWIGYTNQGYGRLNDRKKVVSAHRVAYELEFGKVPDGLVIDHLCRMRCCVNPAHLRVVTNAENTLCGAGLPALNKRKTHCLRGHAFTAENTYCRGPRRQCRRCIYERCRSRRLASRRSSVSA